MLAQEVNMEMLAKQNQAATKLVEQGCFFSALVLDATSFSDSAANTRLKQETIKLGRSLEENSGSRAGLLGYFGHDGMMPNQARLIYAALAQRVRRRRATEHFK